MTLVIVIIAAVTTLLSTMFLAAAISNRPAQKCLFDKRIVFTAASRYDGEACIGKPENVYVSQGGPTEKLHDVRVCNGHVPLLMDVANQLIRESK